jgi:plastocyanin
VRWTAGFAALVLLAVAPVARAAGPTVSITASTFKPAIVVVAPGTTVTWRDDDAVAHSLSGDVRSPAPIAPGTTYARKFTSTGDYHYADAANSAKQGTVVVAASGRSHPSRPPGPRSKLVTHRYTGTMTLTVREQFRFYDGHWQSFVGACNAEVGGGTRTVLLRAKLNHAKYTRGFGSELLSDLNAPATLVRYSETVKAKLAQSGSELVGCQDGKTQDRTADVSVDCSANQAGKHFRIGFGWGPSSSENRFQYSTVDHTGFDACGSDYIGGLSLVGVKDFSLPLNLVGGGFVYDEGNTSPATAHEVAAMRAGRALRVVRSIDLDFLTDCCDPWAPHGDFNTRIGTAHTVKAKLEIKLRPR